LAACSERLPQLNLRWSGSKSTRRDYATLCEIPLDIQREELEHRIEVFGADPNFGSRKTNINAA
jgi:methionyl-tRNA formyltransferase